MANVTWKAAPTAAELLERAKDAKLAEINAAYTAAMEPLLKTYPEVETKGWDAQRSEAQAYQAWLDAGSSGSAPATPVLDKILSGRNGVDGAEPLAELVGKVLTNAQAFIDAQEMTGYRHRLEKQITDATSTAEVEAITW